MQEKLIIKEEGEFLKIKIVGEIDHHTATQIRTGVDSALFNVRPKVLILDFSLVKFMDSSGIGLIIGRCEKAKSVGATVKLTELSKTAYKIATLSGLQKIENLEMEKRYEKNTK